jgi:hypothetical protein
MKKPSDTLEAPDSPGEDYFSSSTTTDFAGI